MKEKIANQNKYLRKILWKIRRLTRRSVGCECGILDACLHHYSWHRATYMSVLVTCNIYTGHFRVWKRTLYWSDAQFKKKMTTRLMNRIRYPMKI